MFYIPNTRLNKSRVLTRDSVLFDTMDTVKWGHTSAMEADDILVSDNVLQFVKDEDIVNPDEILPPGN